MLGNSVVSTSRRVLGALFIGLALAGTALAQQPLKIGFGMSLTGPLAGNGKAALIAMEIWRDDVNAKGGILGRKVEFVYYDDQTSPATVPSIYAKLLDVDKVDLVVSGYGTNVIAPAMPIMMQRNLTFMTLFGLNVNSKFNYDRYFQIMPPGPKPAVGWSQGCFDAAMSMTPRPKTVALVGADAEYPAMALEGAREHAKKTGLKIVYDKTYPPNTVDYSPIVRALQAQLGPLLNGVVNYEFYVPDLGSKFPFLDQFLAKYQARAIVEKVDPLGFYLPPYAYAMMQVLEQAITATKGLDQAKLAEYIHNNTFDTYVGKVGFAKNGEWAAPRVMMTQYHGITGNDVEQFKKPGRLTVLSPKEYKTGDLKAPYHENKK